MPSFSLCPNPSHLDAGCTVRYKIVTGFSLNLFKSWNSHVTNCHAEKSVYKMSKYHKGSAMACAAKPTTLSFWRRAAVRMRRKTQVLWVSFSGEEKGGGERKTQWGDPTRALMSLCIKTAISLKATRHWSLAEIAE